MEYQIGSTVLGNWTITKLLGEGGYGKVYEIKKEEYGVTVKAALKVIQIPKSESEIRSAMSDGMDEESVTVMYKQVVDDLMREIAILSSLKAHPNIVRYEDHQVEKHETDIKWTILIRMELLTPLNDYILSHNLTEDDVIKLGNELGEAIVYCERKNLIHRDIKPENTFVDELGHFKLGDFGIARMAEKTSDAMSNKGTGSYMAPEVYMGKPYGKTVDIYSLGLMMYKLLNRGRLPFYPLDSKVVNYNDRQNAISRRLRGEKLPKPIDASERLSAVILKACSYDAKDRYQNGEDFLKDLLSVKSKEDEDTHYLSKQDSMKFDQTEYIGVGNSKINEDETKENNNLDEKDRQNRDKLIDSIEMDSGATTPIGIGFVQRKDFDVSLEKSIDVKNTTIENEGHNKQIDNPVNHHTESKESIESKDERQTESLHKEIMEEEPDNRVFKDTEYSLIKTNDYIDEASGKDNDGNIIDKSALKVVIVAILIILLLYGLSKCANSGSTNSDNLSENTTEYKSDNKDDFENTTEKTFEDDDKTSNTETHTNEINENEINEEASEVQNMVENTRFNMMNFYSIGWLDEENLIYYENYKIGIMNYESGDITKEIAEFGLNNGIDLSGFEMKEVTFECLFPFEIDKDRGYRDWVTLRDYYGDFEFYGEKIDSNGKRYDVYKFDSMEENEYFYVWDDESISIGSEESSVTHYLKIYVPKGFDGIVICANGPQVDSYCGCFRLD